MSDASKEPPAFLSDLFSSPAFQKKLDAIGTEQPRFVHTCSYCKFLGIYELDGVHYDLYIHKDRDLTSRHGGNPADITVATLSDAKENRYAHPAHPIIEALRRFEGTGSE